MAKPTFTAGTALSAAKLTQIADLLYGTDGWVAFTLANSWVSRGAPWANPEYRVAGGVVHLRGMVKSGTWGATMFTLPAGSRPTETRFLPTMSNGVLSALDVASNGEVKVAGGAGGSNAWVSLDGITIPL